MQSRRTRAEKIACSVKEPISPGFERCFGGLRRVRSRPIAAIRRCAEAMPGCAKEGDNASPGRTLKDVVTTDSGRASRLPLILNEENLSRLLSVYKPILERHRKVLITFLHVVCEKGNACGKSQPRTSTGRCKPRLQCGKVRSRTYCLPTINKFFMDVALREILHSKISIE